MYLITGAAGFIGSGVVHALNARGRSDLVLADRFGKGDKWKNLLGARFAEFVDRDFLFERLADADWAPDIDTVIHLGACAVTTETDMDLLYEVNTEYSMDLCQWSLDHGARFVYASSAAVYGDGSLGFSDDHALTPRLRPLNPYGFSKWLFDMWLLEQDYAEEVAGLRFFNVYGPREGHKGPMASVVQRAFPQAREEGRVRLFQSHHPDCADGEQRRDFIYLDDAVNIVLHLAEHKDQNGIFNAGTGRARSFNDLAAALLKALGKPVNIEYFPMPEEIRPRYQYFTQADVGKLTAARKNGAFTSLEDGVRNYVQEYLLKG